MRENRDNDQITDVTAEGGERIKPGGVPGFPQNSVPGCKHSGVGSKLNKAGYILCIAGSIVSVLSFTVQIKYHVLDHKTFVKALYIYSGYLLCFMFAINSISKHILKIKYNIEYKSIKDVEQLSNSNAVIAMLSTIYVSTLLLACIFGSHIIVGTLFMSIFAFINN